MSEFMDWWKRLRLRRQQENVGVLDGWADLPGLDWGYERIRQFPHCDSRVLHAPGECRFCDDQPAWQALRTVWGIAYTGHKPLPGQTVCPSDARRGTGGAHVWPGNQPHERA